MFRALVTFGLCILCSASVPFAADLPLLTIKSPLVHHQKNTFRKKSIASKPQLIAVLPAVTNSLATQPQLLTEKNPAAITHKPMSNMAWVLGPMSANADGGKHESSVSATANIIVEKPGTSYGPEIVVELEGHVVKTVQSTVRLDIQVGDFKKSVQWNADEVKSGVFKISINQKIASGVLPELIPVSAIAFVTQAGEGHAAMVSLERIVLRFKGSQIISSK